MDRNISSFSQGESARSREHFCYLPAHMSWFAGQVKQFIWLQAVKKSEGSLRWGVYPPKNYTNNKIHINYYST